MSKILIMGSISIDNVVYTKTMPTPGTTTFGESYIANVGGKGANQACASLFLGGDVVFFGSIGKDNNGQMAKEFLQEQGLKAILKESDKATGYASITVDAVKGENQIVIVTGANMDIKNEDVDKIEYLYSNSSFFLTQLENPVETVLYALKKAKKYGLVTILNPAPYHELLEEIYQYIDFFVPNEHELDGFVKGDASFEEKAREVLKRGCKNVIVTLGEKGSLLVNENEVYKAEPHKVKAIDTTAAGDSYLGAFVTALSQGRTVHEAMNFASLCSSKTVTKKGAIISLPSIDDLN